MSKADRVHFDEYSDQNRAKHSILSGYLPAYLTALKYQASAFHYIDGFAGRGRYESCHSGSPLIALEIVGATGLASRSTISLVESDHRFYSELKAAVENHEVTAQLAEPPFIRHGEFANYLDAILSRDICRKTPCATFAFIDPCGVAGVRMADLAKLLKSDFGEVLLFFNYDGINRVIGQALAMQRDSRLLFDLFGDQAILQSAIEEVQRATTAEEREAIVRGTFVEGMRRLSGAQYYVPFRFESPAKEKTSHYLVHCCRKPLGFKIMKEVMNKTGRGAGNQYGSLEFQTDRERGKQMELLRFDIEEQKRLIVQRIASQPCKVSHFTKEWASRPTDMFAESLYKTMLLELEQVGRIRVYDKQNCAPAPPSSRRAGTLGPDYWLRYEIHS